VVAAEGEHDEGENVSDQSERAEGPADDRKQDEVEQRAVGCYTTARLTVAAVDGGEKRKRLVKSALTSRHCSRSGVHARRLQLHDYNQTLNRQIANFTLLPLDAMLARYMLSSWSRQYFLLILFMQY